MFTFNVIVILIISFASDANSALSTAQLEKNINAKLKKMQDDHVLELTGMATKYKELKDLSAKEHAYTDKKYLELKNQSSKYYAYFKKKYEEAKSQCDKTSASLTKDINDMASVINNQQAEINYLRTELKKEDIKIDQINQDVPIGFVYMELPYTLPATKLWPNFKWRDITLEYAGLFFRAEGGGAAAFGEVQQANQSWVSNIKSSSYYYDTWKGPHGSGTYTAPLQYGNWSMDMNHSNGLIRNLYVFTTEAENRPRNTAVKYWQRV